MRLSILAALLAAAACTNASAAEPRLVPAPRQDVAPSGGLQTAVLAGGCFWGVEAVFEHVKGVRSVVSGYAGGSAADANYRAVSAGRTDHAEVVKIVFDPRAVSYGTLLRLFFSVAHDPTQLDRQGPDVGQSYRSAIFPQDREQRAVAAAYIVQLRQSGVFRRPIVTRIESGPFHLAERSHQDFMRKNPLHPYILAHDAPKLRALKRAAPSLYRS
ncbi:MAG TPA: peptide-methionine (S)-S-oxide reductase MsrA [Sphingomicrobium sp.]|nr:peptide-methionine (S)-S-oxide reductase MsrA [Sphingomicrobium sp.]